MNISDFPFPFDTKYHFPTREEICRYYEAYCKHFELQEHISFRTTVLSVTPGSDAAARWWVTVAPTDNLSAPLPPERFDAILVASGQFSQAQWPRLEGKELFQGTIQHSKTYRNPADLHGKRVLIVGIGNSALDISLEVARSQAAAVDIACRSGTNIIPVTDYYGMPADQLLVNRLYSSLPAQARLLSFYSLIGGTNKRFREAGLQEPSSTAGHGHFSNLKEHVEYRAHLASGRIRLQRGIKSLSATSVTFEDGKSIQVDHIICCTGYAFNFPFLCPALLRSSLISQDTVRSGEQGTLRYMRLYRNVLHPEHPTLGFLCIALTYGNESCLGEMQARWALSLWRGAAPCPTQAEVHAAVHKMEEAVKGMKPKFAQFVNYIKYMDGLAADIGCLPPSWDLSRPTLSWKLYAAPTVPAQYRLQGPHAWDGARRFLESQESAFSRLFMLMSQWRRPDHDGALPIQPLRAQHSKM